MFCVLGSLPENQKQDYQFTNFTNHAELRSHRLDLIGTINVLYYFEVYRSKDNSKQVHCLMEDSSIIVFSMKTKKVITVILADLGSLNKYINKVDIEGKNKMILIRCAELNGKYKTNKIELSDKESKDYLERKLRILAYR